MSEQAYSSVFTRVARKSTSSTLEEELKATNSSSKEEVAAKLPEEFTTLPHNLFTINNVNTTLCRLTYGAAVEVVHSTAIEALDVIG